MSEIDTEEYVELLKLKAEQAFKDGVEEGVRSVLWSIICNFLYRHDEGIDYYPLLRALCAEEFKEDFYKVFKSLENPPNVIWDKKKNGYVLSTSMRDILKADHNCGACGKNKMDMMLAEEPFSFAGNSKYPKYSKNKGNK